MAFLKNIVLLVVATGLAHVTAVYFGVLYGLLYPDVSVSGLGWIGTAVSESYFDGILASYVFFVTVLLVAFGQDDKYKYMWIVVFLLPAVWFLSQLHLSQLLFGVIVALLGWGIGFGINNLLSTANKKA